MHLQSRPKTPLFNLVILIYLVSLTVSSADLSKDARIRLGKHTDSVNSIVFSPDGKMLASASARVIKLWSVDNRLGMDIPKTYRNNMTSVAFSPDGRLLASASKDKTVKLWDVKSRIELYTFRGHNRGVTSVAFSPDGKLLASASKDKTVKLWEIESRSEFYTFPEHDRSVNLVAFSPDGKMLASASEDNTVRLWDVEGKHIIDYLTEHSRDVYSVAFSPDGKMLASASEDNTVRLWDVEDRRYVGVLEGHRGSVNSVVFSSDGRFLISGGSDDTIKLWDVEGKHEIDTLTGHSKNVKSVAFSSKGATLASGSDDGTIYLWDLSLFGVTPRIPASSIQRESPTPLVSRLPLSATGPAGVLRQFGPSFSVYTVDLSPDGQILASGGDDNTFKLWDVASGRELKTFTEHNDRIECVAFSPDGRVLASASIDGSVKLWGVYSHRKLATLKHSDWVECVAFSPNGRVLASASIDGSIKLWDVQKKKNIATFTGHSAGVSSVAFSSDNRLLASASYDSTVKLWDVVSRQEFNTFSGHSRPISSVAFSPDGGTLASGSTDNTVRLWDVFSQRELATLEHESYVESVAFSPNGRLLASAGVDSTIKLWNVDRKNVIATLEGHRNSVTSVAFSSDGMTLASGSRDRKVFLWNLSHFGIDELRLSPDLPKVFENSLAILPEESESQVNVPEGSNSPEIAKPKNSSIPTLLGDSELLVSERIPLQYDRDTTRPNIVIISPTERVVLSTVKQVEVAGIATDDSGIYEVTVNGKEATVIEAGRFKAKILLGYGENEIIVTATDTQNNVARKRFTIVRETTKPSPAPKTISSAVKDTTGPEIRLLSPVARIQRGAKAKIRLTTNSTLVTGTVTDPSGVYKVTVDGVEAQVSGERFTATVQLAYGDNLIRVTATDTLHNPATRQFTIIREEALHTKTGTDYALLFATDSYIHWPNLWNPLLDAEAIRVDLQEIYGFQVELVYNPTREEILESLLKYADKKYTEEDQLLIFFAGHGYFNDKFREGYLVARDTKRSDDDITMSSYLPHSVFRNYIDRMLCKHIFLVMDTCYSGTFDQRIATRGEADDVSKPLSDSEVKRKLKYTTRWYLTSGGKEQVPDGVPGRNSPFARELLEALRSSGGRDNILTIDEVLMYLDRIKDPKPRSSGFGSNEPGSDFLFIAK